MDIAEFIKSTDFMKKLEAALTRIQDFAMFEGIQNGRCTVDITMPNPEYVYIEAHPKEPAAKLSEPVELRPPLMTDAQVASIPETIAVVEGDAPLEQDEPPSKKRKRYTG